MSYLNHPNLAYALITIAPSPATSGVTLDIDNPSRFPDPASVGNYSATIWPADVFPTIDNSEIVLITGLSGSTLTITRTQESTSARTVIVGDSIAATITKKTLTDIETQTVLKAGDTMTGNLTISNTAPTLTLTDTTASAKSLTVAVDANIVDLRESAGASGSLMVLDLANNRVGIGTSDFTDFLGLVGLSTKFKVADGNMQLEFTDYSSGQGFMAVSNGTIKGFTGHTNTNEGFVIGAYSNHGLVLRASLKSALKIDSNGHTYIATINQGSFTGTAGSQLQVDANASTTIGLIVKGATSQSADLQQWLNSSGTVFGKFSLGTYGGKLSINNSSGVESISFGLPIADSAPSFYLQSSGGKFFGALVGSTAAVFSYDETGLFWLEHRNNTANIGNGTANGNMFVWSNGQFIFSKNAYASNGNSTTAPTTQQVLIDTNASTFIGLIVKGATSQSADLQQWLNSAGGILLNVQPDGDLEFHANNIVTDTTTGTKIGTATSQKLGLWNVTPIIQPVTSAYTSDGEGSAYTGIDNLQVGSVYATVADLNQLRVAYETLRASYDDLLTKLKTTGIVG